MKVIISLIFCFYAVLPAMESQMAGEFIQTGVHRARNKVVVNTNIANIRNLFTPELEVNASLSMYGNNIMIGKLALLNAKMSLMLQNSHFQGDMHITTAHGIIDNCTIRKLFIHVSPIIKNHIIVLKNSTVYEDVICDLKDTEGQLILDDATNIMGSIVECPHLFDNRTVVRQGELKETGKICTLIEYNNAQQKSSVKDID